MRWTRLLQTAPDADWVTHLDISTSSSIASVLSTDVSYTREIALAWHRHAPEAPRDDQPATLSPYRGVSHVLEHL
jgi:hypothetical protein